MSEYTGPIAGQIAGLCVPADPSHPIRPVSVDPRDVYAVPGVVGGHIVPIHQDAPPVTFWLRQDAAGLGLPVNSRATVLVQLTKRWAHSPYLRGTVALTGHPDARGAPTSVPQQVLTLLLHARLFKIEVELGGNGWATNAMLFTDWLSAAIFVIDLGRRWPEVTATRIAPADPPPAGPRT